MKLRWAGWLLVFQASAAFAGGFSFPDVGSEALGRGAAFTAKADSPLALEYNVAGLAQQRSFGNLLLDSTFAWDSYAFTRDGAYTTPGSEQGLPFPRVASQGTPTILPFIGLSFAFKDRWTLALGTHFEPIAGTLSNRTFAIQSPGFKDSPARYDVLYNDWRIQHWQLAGAYRATDYLDVGLGLDVLWGHFVHQTTLFNENNATKSDPNAPSCLPEDTRCDVTASTGVQDEVTAAAVAGVLLRARSDLIFGANIRTATNFSGRQNNAAVETALPWMLRVGVRYVCHENDDPKGREVMDIEVDGTYEAWGRAEDNGDKLQTDKKTFQTPRMYRDTYSIRVGGAYNFSFEPLELTTRLGIFYDSSATIPSNTRLDFNTLQKLGLTIGLGFNIKAANGLRINLAYSWIYQPDRVVQFGNILAIDQNSGNSLGANGGLPTINNGTYSGGFQLFSIGFTLPIDSFAGHPARFDTKRP